MSNRPIILTFRYFNAFSDLPKTQTLPVIDESGLEDAINKYAEVYSTSSGGELAQVMVRQFDSTDLANVKETWKSIVSNRDIPWGKKFGVMKLSFNFTTKTLYESERYVRYNRVAMARRRTNEVSNTSNSKNDEE